MDPNPRIPHPRLGLLVACQDGRVQWIHRFHPSRPVWFGFSQSSGPAAAEGFPRRYPRAIPRLVLFCCVLCVYCPVWAWVHAARSRLPLFSLSDCRAGGWASKTEGRHSHGGGMGLTRGGEVVGVCYEGWAGGNGRGSAPQAIGEAPPRVCFRCVSVVPLGVVFCCPRWCPQSFLGGAENSTLDLTDGRCTTPSPLPSPPPSNKKNDDLQAQCGGRAGQGRVG